MTIDQPLVSVFMPVYNQQEFVGAAIESALAQDYENLEIVIGDDCSSDRTWEIVLDYQRRFPGKIKAFRNERNLGITGNCNEILKRCEGEYIAFYAGDDIYLPGKIRKQVEAMKKDEAIILCYHDIEVFNSETNKTIRYWNHGPSSTPPVVGAAHDVARAVVAFATSFMAALSVMARADALPASGFDARVPVASDWLMWIEILANAKPGAAVVYLNEVLARYRRHATNVTNLSGQHASDVFSTLALVECRYPWLIDEIEHFRAAMRYSFGVQLIRDGDFALGRNYLIRGARGRLFTHQWLGWFTASYFPIIRPRK